MFCITVTPGREETDPYAWPTHRTPHAGSESKPPAHAGPGCGRGGLFSAALATLTRLHLLPPHQRSLTSKPLLSPVPVPVPAAPAEPPAAPALPQPVFWEAGRVPSSVQWCVLSPVHPFYSCWLTLPPFRHRGVDAVLYLNLKQSQDEEGRKEKPSLRKSPHTNPLPAPSLACSKAQ